MTSEQKEKITSKLVDIIIKKLDSDYISLENSQSVELLTKALISLSKVVA